ncbi:MAG: aromatic amino acid transport family protein [Candidatus Woesearchaeota archaeon]
MREKKSVQRLHAYEATATLIGTIIGAGVLGIPYVMAKAGFLTGLLVLLLLGTVILTINLCIGEVVLRTKGLHQLTGYVGIYLGDRGRRLMTVAMIVGNYGALMAYIIGEGRSLAEVFGGNPWVWSAVFFAIGSFIIYRGLMVVGFSELVLSGIKFSALFIILVLMVSSRFFDPSHLMHFDISKFFVPYGVILFAFLGAIAIPEMREELSGHLKDMKRAIIIGSIIPLIAYALFGFAVVGVTGYYTTEVANVGIGRLMGFVPLLIVNLFAVMAMATSFIAIGLGLKEMYEYDYGIKPLLSFVLTLSVPVLLILAGIHSFIKILGLTGALAGGLEGILLLLTYWKARRYGQRKPEYEVRVGLVPIALIVVAFVIGAIITIKETTL